MDRQDQHAIDELFRKIDNVEGQSGSRDHEAESYIESYIAQNPAAAYYMAQTIIVQEQALNAAQRRIEELESQPAQSQSGGGLFGGLFGGASRRVPNTGGQRRMPQQDYQQPVRQSRGMGMGGGGFLAGAAQTAMGVAGGVVLGSMLADMLSPDEAAAAGLGDTAGADEGGWFGGEDTANAGDTQLADAGGDDFGGDFGGDF